MQKWEYARLIFTNNAPKGASQWNLEMVGEILHGDTRTLVQMLNDAGVTAWEVISVLPGPPDGFLLKRVKTEISKPDFGN